MEKERRIRRGLLIGLITAAWACTPVIQEDMTRCTVIFTTDGFMTKALDPEEDKVTDISLMVFDEMGNAEECIWIPEAGSSAGLTLVKGKSYDFRACANFGYQVYADHLRELDEVTFHMAYPDEYQEGIPMYAAVDDIVIGEDGIVNLMFDRLMAKIDIRMDRSRLSEDIEMNVRNVKICNCPKMMSVFVPNKVKKQDQCHTVGFSRNDLETSELNISGKDGKSGNIALYMMENMQGRTSPDASVCSYIEMEVDYMSKDRYSLEPLIYRFYLGDGQGSLDIERNSHYRITVCPEDDGLSDDGWRVDKNGLTDRIPVSFKQYPSDYIQGYIGDKIHIWCEFTPESASFDVGTEYMEDDKKRGIYDYRVDPDGHGAVLTLMKPGRGLIYMSAGEPVNEDALFIIDIQPYMTSDSSSDPPEFLQTQDFLQHLRPRVPDL